MTNQSSHLPWIKNIRSALRYQHSGPVVAQLPSFPWELFADNIKKTFYLSHCEISLKSVFSFQEQSFLGEDASAYKIVKIQALPLNQHLYLSFSKQALSNILRKLMQSSEELRFSDAELGKAFDYFLFANIIHALQQSAFIPNLSLSFSFCDKTHLDDEAVVIDVNLQLDDQYEICRLFIPQAFKNALEYHLKDHALKVSSQLAEHTPIELQVEVGKVVLAQQQVKALKRGDFVLLDQCLYFPEKSKGRALLTLNQTPIFRLLYGKDSVKILEYPTFQEVKAPMNQTPQNPDEFPEDNQAPLEEEFDTLDELPELEGEIPDLDEDDVSSDTQESEAFEHAESAVAANEQESYSEEVSSLNEAPVSDTLHMISPSEIPISLSVEVSRLNMTLKDLMDLQPGNTLDLDTTPEQGVSLVSNGKVLAKGELIQIGEALGVKILEINN